MEEVNDMTLEEYLRDRGIPEESIRYFVNEYIDAVALQIMEEEKLKVLIPPYGDRLAILQFCKRKLYPKKLSLIEKLREKIAKKNSSNEKVNTRRVVLSKQKKSTRVIEVGWLCYSSKEKKLNQVKVNYGGGTRKVVVEKSSTMEDIRRIAEELFFPNNSSPKGHISEFERSLLDFKQNNVDNLLTVEEIFRITKLTKLRFYLATERKSATEMSDPEFVIRSPSRSVATSLNRTSTRSFTATSSTTENHSNSNIPLPVKNGSYSLNWPPMSDESDSENHLINVPVAVSVNVDPPSNFFSSSIQGNLEGSDVLFLGNINDQDFEENQVTFDYLHEIPMTLSAERRVQKLILHRGFIFSELLEAFMHNDLIDCILQFEIILPTGESERAEDAGGVFRDVLSEFWGQFYDKCTSGTNYKVPYLRHDYGEIQWKAVGDILLKGFKEEKYLPIKIAPVFLKTVIDSKVSEEELLQNFMEYVPESESSILKKSINDFETADIDELTDILSSYDSKWMPKAENVKQLIADIAHKELIQRPAFITKCFKKIFINEMNQVDIDSLYMELAPTLKNILNKITLCNENNNKKHAEIGTVFKHLTKFIKESDLRTRENFLRFCTGSDLVITEITVCFNDNDGFKRAPVSHTCTGVLELPTTYENYLVFRSEFKELLESKIWIMDII